MTSRRIALLAAAAVTLLAMCAAPAAQAGTVPAAPAAEPAPAWQPCADGAVQCATLSVPVVHAEPDGERIDLALARLPAQDPATRRGTLVFHGGGPAPSLHNVLEPRDRAALVDLSRWFDVVTFDSRGYGRSVPLCDPELAPIPALLTSPAAHAEAQRQNRAYGESCRAGHPTLAEHASAEDAAHDIDAIRRALGEEKISFFGNSYGTVFGQEYAEHYGDRLERLLLDSVVDHTSSYRAANLDGAVTAEAMLHRFTEDCAADPGCPLHDQDPLAVWDEVVAAAEQRPLPAGPGRTISADELRSFSPVLGHVDRDRFAAALASARDGDGSGLAAMIPASFPVRDGGQLTACLDLPAPADYAEQQAASDEARQLAPRVGWLPGLDEWRCTGWPIPATNEPAPLDAPLAPAALLVNATLDPSTHLIGARRVADQIEGSAVLPVDGLAHSNYLGEPDNRCIRDTVHRYLLDAALPEPGTQCPVTRPVGFPPSGAG